jgi:hypothetical protein
MLAVAHGQLEVVKRRIEDEPTQAQNKASQPPELRSEQATTK